MQKVVGRAKISGHEGGRGESGETAKNTASYLYEGVRGRGAVPVSMECYIGYVYCTVPLTPVFSSGLHWRPLAASAGLEMVLEEELLIRSMNTITIQPKRYKSYPVCFYRGRPCTTGTARTPALLDTRITRVPQHWVAQPSVVPFFVQLVDEPVFVITVPTAPVRRVGERAVASPAGQEPRTG